VSLAIVGLALAIGIGTATLSIVYAFNFRPLGVPDATAVVRVSRQAKDGSGAWSYAEFTRLRDAVQQIDLEATVRRNPVLEDPTSGLPARSVPAEFVSGGFFQTMKMRPAVGRVLVAEDDRPGAAAVAVINLAFWRNVFDADPSIVGRTVIIGGAPATIVGVAGDNFSGPWPEPPALLLPMRAGAQLYPKEIPGDAASGLTVDVIGRLAAADRQAAAMAELSAVVPAVSLAVGRSIAPDATLRFRTAGAQFTGEDAFVTTVLFALVTLVLLLAAANVANLLLASATSRQQEIGTRLALGASRGRIARQLLTESLLIGGVAGALGFLLAYWLLPLAFLLDIPIPPSVELRPDVPVLLVIVALSLVTGAAAGLAPARFGARGDVLTPLKGDDAHSSAAPRVNRWRRVLLGAQAAASMALLVLASLFGRALIDTATRDYGYDVWRLLEVTPLVPDRAVGPDMDAYFDAVRQRVANVHGVTGVAVANPPPFSNAIFPVDFTKDGVTYTVVQTRSSADYFQTIGRAIVRGRSYTESEVRFGARVAVVNQSLGRLLWGDADPLGRTLDQIGTEFAGVRVIGVARDAFTSRQLNRGTHGSIYRPMVPEHLGAARLVVRADDPASVRQTIAAAIAGADSVVRPRVRLISESLDRSLVLARLLATAGAIVGGFALTLSAIGLVGVTSFVIAQRRREIGVRLALGASGSAIVRLLFRDGLRPVVIGMAAGLAIALAGGPIFAGLLYGISPYDPVAIAAATIVLLGAVSLAIAFPARNAVRTDPMRVLRT
jgi:predicted permease